MATKLQLQALDRYVDVIHQLLMDRVNNQQRRLVQTHRNVYTRMFAQLLYDAPKIFTGKVSVDMVDRKLHDFRAKPCPEHYLSRQKGGEELINLIGPDGVPRILVQSIVMKYCAVHYTTPEENLVLKAFQRQHHDETAYTRAGIVLIEARDLFTKRGHSEGWKEQMRTKYAPIVQHYLTSSSLIKDNQYAKDNNEARNL